jgi:hypothetical protein
MKKRIIILLYVLLPLSSALSQSIVSKDWVIFDQLTLGKYVRVDPYFVNQNIGFIFGTYIIFNYTPATNMYRTLDGGKSWKYLKFFEDEKSIVQQMYFSSLDHGYVATSTGVYETNDSGNSWRRITKDSIPYNSVYAVHNKIYAYAFDRKQEVAIRGAAPSVWGPFISTEDNGAHWDTICSASFYKPYFGFTGTLPLIFGNKEDFVFSETSDAQGSLFLKLSTNNGKSWWTQLLDTALPVSAADFQKYGVAGKDRNTFGMYCLPHCIDIFRYPTPTVDSLLLIDVTPFLHSSDFGRTWDTVSDPIEAGGWIVGNSCVLYACNVGTFNSGGIFRSLDRGHSWKWINDWPNFDEFDDNGNVLNLSAVGGGAVLYAGDTYGRLCRSDDGVDGRLSAAALASRVAVSQSLSSGGKDTLLGSVCDSLTALLTFENLSCNYTLMDSIAIEGLDSSEYTTELKHHIACDDLPDTLLIRLHSPFTGSKNVVVHSHFTNDEFETIDTSLSFILSITPGTSVTATIYAKADQISGRAGDTIEIPLFINAAPSLVQTGSVSIKLSYFLHTDLLNPFVFIPVKGVTADPVQVTKTTAMITLHFDPSFSFTGETKLGKLRCVAYVIPDTLQTDITLNKAESSSSCFQSIANSNVAHFTLTGCGSQTLSNFMKYGRTFDILNITPNPANTTVLIMLKNNGSLLYYELLDPLGAVRKEGITKDDHLRIDLSDISSSIYYFRLRGEEGLPITTSIIVTK